MISRARARARTRYEVSIRTQPLAVFFVWIGVTALAVT
jgi:hypothetical protein